MAGIQLARNLPEATPNTRLHARSPNLSESQRERPENLRVTRSCHARNVNIKAYVVKERVRVTWLVPLTSDTAGKLSCS